MVAKTKMLVKKEQPQEEVVLTEPTEATQEATQEKVDVPGVEKTEPKPDTKNLIQEIAQDVSKMENKKAFALVPKLLNTIDQDYFKLGGVLAAINNNGWFLEQGFDNFKAYVESETGMQYRKAMYLIGIFEGLVASGVEWEMVKHLGWSKLKELAGIISVENAKEWIDRAELMSVTQLSEYIKSVSKGDAQTGDGVSEAAEAMNQAQKVTTLTFKMHEDQKETVRNALAKMKHESGFDADSVALEHICLEFLGTAPKKTQKGLAEMFKEMDALEILGIFETVFPHIELQAEFPEEA